MRERFRGALLGAALGDALGAPFEGCSRVPEAAVDAHWRSSEPLRFTDDTRMMMALAGALIERRTIIPELLARRFAEVYGDDPSPGDCGGTSAVFRMMAEGSGWEDASRSLFSGLGSHGNGAATRVAPVGLVCMHDLEAAAALAATTAAPTHAHPRGIEAAALQACAVAVCLSLAGESADRRAVVWAVAARIEDLVLRRALRWLAAMPLDVSARQIVRGLGTSSRAEESVPAAIAAFISRGPRFEDVVRFAVRLGGDTDTIACMAGALAGAVVGERGLPTALLARLGGRGEIRAMADAIADLRAEPPERG